MPRHWARRHTCGARLMSPYQENMARLAARPTGSPAEAVIDDGDGLDQRRPAVWLVAGLERRREERGVEGQHAGTPSELVPSGNRIRSSPLPSRSCMSVRLAADGLARAADEDRAPKARATVPTMGQPAHVILGGRSRPARCRLWPVCRARTSGCRHRSPGRPVSFFGRRADDAYVQADHPGHAAPVEPGEILLRLARNEKERAPA